MTSGRHEDGSAQPPAQPPAQRPTRPPKPTRTDGALALASTHPVGTPPLASMPARLRLVASPYPAIQPDSEHTLDDDLRAARAERAIATFLARQPTSADRLPDARGWAARLAQAIVETLQGQRPLQQLMRWTDDSVYVVIADRLGSRPRAVPVTRPVVRSIRICAPSDGIAEASVVVQSGPRCRALAMRLEGLDGRWRCTALEII